MSKNSAGATSPTEREASKVLSISLALVFVQTILNTLGFGGMITAISMYVMAVAVGAMFEFDRAGVHPSKDERMSSSDYMSRSGIDFLFVLLGFLMWFIAGIFQGLDKTIEAFNNPGDAIDELSGTSFFMKLLYAEISHLTLFAFWQIWVNIYNATSAYYSS